MSLIRRFVDERFFEHRRRSTSAAGIACGLLAVALFEYRLLFEHVWDWYVLCVAITFVIVKLGLMAWYSFTN